MCEEFLSKYSTVGELCTHLGLAIKYNLKKLQEFCEKEIVAHAVVVFKSDGFTNCSKNVLESVLKLNGLSCTEMDIFNACMVWAETACKKKGTDAVDKKNLRAELGECFFLLPFVTMTVSNFCEVVFVNRAIFTLDEVADIMTCITKGKSTELSKKFANHHTSPPSGHRLSSTRRSRVMLLNNVAIQKLLDDVCKNENVWPFLRPVSRYEVPDYHKVITNPMDLARIKNKMNVGLYGFTGIHRRSHERYPIDLLQL